MENWKKFGIAAGAAALLVATFASEAWAVVGSMCGGSCPGCG